jgi:tetratricopeptide (TPR) repeat protein
MTRNVTQSFFICLAFLSSFNLPVQAQDNQFTDSLKLNLANAQKTEQKIFWLGELTEFYMGVDKELSDMYAGQQLKLAEESRDRKLLVLSYLCNARRHYNFSGRQEYIFTGIRNSEKALDIAKKNNLPEHEAWAYNYLANGLRLNAEYDKALNHNSLALSIATGLDDDSLKVHTYNALAKTYLSKREKMLAFRNFLQALNIAESTDNFDLRRTCYRNLADFYTGLDEFEKAKDILYKLISMTFQYHRKFERLEAYNDLGAVYAKNKQYDMAQSFYDHALALADTVHFEVIKLNMYSNMINMYLSSNQYARALEFFDSKPELRNFMRNAGFDHFIDQVYGMAYTMMNKLDSGFFYLKRAEPVFEKNASKTNLYWFYSNMVTFYKKKGDQKTALQYALKADAISASIGDLELRRVIAGTLDTLYQENGDFRKAYYYNHAYQSARDSLSKLSQEKDLMVLELENEKRRKDREAMLEEQAKRDRHYIQYMGITLAIAGVFIVLVMLGIFSVSHATIRILGFFAFIFLFEFIILIADNQIHHWTHGEPWKILAIKIGLISILLPLHHYLEEKVIHYLTTRKLLEINKEALFNKFLSRKESE